MILIAQKGLLVPCKQEGKLSTASCLEKKNLQCAKEVGVGPIHACAVVFWVLLRRACFSVVLCENPAVKRRN